MLTERTLAAVVVLYHPSHDVIHNIMSYLEHVSTLYIIDNSTDPHPLLKHLAQFPKIKIIHKGSNIGIAKGLNLALINAQNDDYQWLMTMDQDSSFDTDNLKKYLNDFKNLDTKDVALVSPLHNSKFVNTSLENPFIKKEIVMTSANIVNIHIALSVVGYDEKLFIDEVDHAFCFLLEKNHYKILQNDTVSVNHMLGRAHIKNPHIKLYPSIRLYYMIRNYLYIKHKYSYQHKHFFKQRDKYLLKFFIRQLLFGDSRFKNILMITQGIIDYRKKQFGKYND